MRKQCTLIDFLKLFFAICVVGLHTGIMQNEESNFQWYIMHGIFRLAVPFFFVCSGFFLGLKMYQANTVEEGINKIKIYIKRLIIPFIVWLIIALPIQIYNYRTNSLIITIIKIVRRVFFYPWGALWYILALIVATIIIVPFYKKNKIKSAVVLGGVLYFFALLCNNYYFVIEGTAFQKIVDIYLKIFVSGRNGIFVGLFFVSMGVYIAERTNKGIKLSGVKSTILLVISYILLVIEIFLIKGNTYKDDHGLFIMLMIVVPQLLICSMNVKASLDTRIIRNYSVGIYFMHAFIIGMIKILLEKYNINIGSQLLFCSALTISIVLLTILYKIDNKQINKIIK